MILDIDNNQVELHSVFLLYIQYLWWYGGLPVNVSFQVISITLSTLYIACIC